MAEFNDTGTGDGHPTGSGGLLAAIRSLADTLLASARQRVELLSLELQEEKLRAVQVLVLLSAAVFSGALAVTFLSLTLVYVFWETARLAVLAGLGVAYAAACGVIVWKLRRLLARQSRPFQATLAELQHDRACIPPQN